MAGSRSRSVDRRRNERSRDDRSRDRGRDQDRDRGRDRDRDRGRDRGWERDSGRRSRHGDSRSRHDHDRSKRSRDLGKRSADRRGRKDETAERKRRALDDSYVTFQKVVAGGPSTAAKEDTGAAALSEKQQTRRLPVELEALEKVAKQKKAADVAGLKPVFLSKAQRKKLAMERLQARQAEEEAKRAEIQKQLEGFRAPRKNRNSEAQERRSRRRDREESSSGRSGDDRHRERMIQAIKQQYLGKKKKKKRIVPLSQKFKFSFDWEPTEDTSVDIDPLYSKRHNANLLFGRGFVGGVDRREQIKKAKFYTDMMQDRETGVDLRDQNKVKARKARDQRRDYEARLANRHWSEKKLEEMEERDWRIFREDFNISTRGVGVPHPLRFWSEADFPPSIIDTLKVVKYEKPSAIQRAAIPVGLRNRDCVGIAVTGSGKTAAFLLPMLVHISKLPKMTEEIAQQGPYALIMAPTRELAQQISDECEKFAKPMGFRSVSIVGGMSYQDQGFALRCGAEVVIATPGRLYDTIERRYLVLNQCNYLVLDEADRMIDEGFEPQLIKILEAMPSSNLRPMDEDEETLLSNTKTYRQTFMFSATMPQSVETLAKKYLRNPVFIAIGERSGRASKSVEQRVHLLSEGAKRKKLLEVLAGQDPPVIVFCNAKKACDVLAKFLTQNGWNATVLHGSKTQDQRMASLAAFKAGDFDILVATDVVGRGIDISGVTLVVNYDMAQNIERYTHRVGRTGRAGKSGLAVSFVTNDDAEVMYDLVQALKGSGNPVPRELAQHPSAKIKPGSGRKPKPTIQYAKK